MYKYQRGTYTVILCNDRRWIYGELVSSLGLSSPPMVGSMHMHIEEIYARVL